MANKTFTYPYDPSGLLLSNKVVEESHTITPANGKDFRFIVPKAAPYFVRSVKLFHAATGKEMIRGTDWVPGHAFQAATKTQPYVEIAGSLLILNNSLSGTFTLKEYQTLGGEYTIDETTALEILANTLLDPRLTTWDKVIDAPLIYDALTHLHHVSTSIGYGDMVTALQNLVTVFTLEASKLNDRITAHLNDALNPHSTSAESVQLARFLNVYRSSLDEVIAGKNNSNFVTAYQLTYMLTKAFNDTGAIGLEGQLPFYTGATSAFSYISDYIMKNVAVVENATDLSAQLAARENFDVVFKTWQRIAASGGNLNAIPGELNGWSYNPATDTISSTINSSSLIGLTSPDSVEGDYVFEVEVSSTNADDDYIGISLGTIVQDGFPRVLALLRSASNPTSSGTPTAIAALNLVYDYMGKTPVTLGTIPNLLNFANGWAGYTAGPVKVRVRRVGTVLYITTTNPGTGYLAEVQFDLNSRPETKAFAGAVNLGYLAFSQAAATWKTIRRTGANPPIAAIHSQQVYEWDGTQYTLVAKPLSSVLKRGRFYRNSLFNRVYYAPSAGAAVKTADQMALMEPVSASKQRGRAVVVDSDGKTLAGNQLQLTTADGTVGGSIRALPGRLEFLNSAGTVMAYFDSNNILQHSGVNTISDKRFKGELELISDKGTLPYYSWVWKDHPFVPATLRGKKGYGVIAQDVRKLLPQFVNEDVINGFLTVDETKLALYLSLVPATQETSE